MLIASFSACLSAHAGPKWWTEHGSDVDITGPQSNNLRAQAVDDGIVRLWIKHDAPFTRKPSKALVTDLPAARPMKVKDSDAGAALTSNDLRVDVDRATGSFTVQSKDGKQTLLQNVQIAFKDGGSWSLSYGLAKDEHLLGLGQDNRNGGKLERRGTIRDLWSGQQINSGNVTASYPVPLLISTGPKGHAYGLFIDNVHHMRFDLGASDKDRVSAAVDGGEADLYIIDGPTPKQVVERYTKLTGRPSLPPLWVLGYWQSKCVFWQWSDIDEAAKQLTARGFPFDVMVIDYSWPEFLNNYKWDKRWSGKDFTPESKIEDYAKKGVKIVMSNSGPMVVKESPTFEPGWKAGVFATDGKGNPVQAGYYKGELLDFTSPSMDGWLYPQVKPLVDSSVAGWWLDLTEPEGEDEHTTYKDGGSADIHNQYSLLETEWFENAQLKAKPDVRPWILTRTGSAGIQRHHASMWTGDIHTDFATLSAHPAEMLSSGLSGINWWTCDSGGFLSGFYKNDQFGAHARLYERWMQFSVFSPITRAHHVGAVMPYEFGSSTEAGCLHYLQLRYKMLPYIYSYAWEASQDGLPITRSLALEYPDDPQSLNTPGDEYLFGREMLVAPVLHDNMSNRAVYFPPGKWIDWDYGYEYDGGKTWVVAAPQNHIPVAVRAGAIIPLAPPLRNTSEKPWDPITLDVFPSGTSTFKLYNDDGKSFKYGKGDETITDITCKAGTKSVSLNVAESNKLYAPKQYIVRFHLNNTPNKVEVDGAAAQAGVDASNLGVGQWVWSAEDRILTIRFASGTAKRHTVVAHYDSQTLPRRIAPSLKEDMPDTAGEKTASGAQ